jgi:predicted RNase H-like HicB family nuclease
MARQRKNSGRRREEIAQVDEVAIRLAIEPLEGGAYLATSPDVPGLVAEGRSVTEAVEIAQGLTRKIVESCLEHGDPLPPAFAKARHAPRELIVPVGIP